jgi:CubicO group peptidase (beta-lactamase class C family)
MAGLIPLDDKADRVDALIEPYAAPGVPGLSVLVIQQGEKTYERVVGLADVEAGTPATPATNYRLASFTKQFTAMTILMLVDESKLSLESTLTELLPDFPAYGGSITVRHLLTHTSGLIAYENVMPDSTTIPLKDRDVLALMMQQDSTYFPPGSSYRYSNTGYAILAMIVEKTAGLSFADFLKQRIFEPLGMDATVAYEQGISEVSNRAYGHAETDQGIARRDQSLTSSVLGDGGIYSSITDLYKWDQALYTDRLVSRPLLEEAMTGATDTHKAESRYGYGWFIESINGRRLIRHTGTTIGFSTAIERIPELELTVIVLSNRNGNDAHTLARRVLEIYLPEK